MLLWSRTTLEWTPTTNTARSTGFRHTQPLSTYHYSNTPTVVYLATLINTFIHIYAFALLWLPFRSSRFTGQLQMKMELRDISNFVRKSHFLWDLVRCMGNGQRFGRSFGVRRCSIHSPTATTISFLRDLEEIGHTSIKTYLARFPMQIRHRRITLSGVTE